MIGTAYFFDVNETIDLSYAMLAFYGGSVVVVVLFLSSLSSLRRKSKEPPTVYELTNINQFVDDRYILTTDHAVATLTAVFELVGKDYSMIISDDQHMKFDQEFAFFLAGAFDKKEQRQYKLSVLGLRMGTHNKREVNDEFVKKWPVPATIGRIWQSYLDGEGKNERRNYVTRKFLCIETETFKATSHEASKKKGELLSFVDQITKLHEGNIQPRWVVTEGAKNLVRANKDTSFSDAKISDTSLEKYLSALFNPCNHGGCWDDAFETAWRVEPNRFIRNSHPLPLRERCPRSNMSFSKEGTNFDQYTGNKLFAMLRSWYDTLLLARTKWSVMEFDDGQNKVFCVSVYVTEWGAKISKLMVDSLLEQPFQVYVRQSLHPRSGEEALKTTASKAVDGRTEFLMPQGQIEERKDALSNLSELIRSNEEAIVNYDFCTLVFGATEKEARRNAWSVRRIMNETHGLTTREAGRAVFLDWRRLFPLSKINERNAIMQNTGFIANVMGLNKSPSGWVRSAYGNEPIVELPGISGSDLYKMHFHNSEQAAAPAHTLISGSTGSGKTTFMLFLLSQLLKYDHLQVVALDSQRGMRVFTEAIGGKSITITTRAVKGKLGLGVNPLALKLDSRENREHILQMFIRMLRYSTGIEGTNESLDTNTMRELNESINAMAAAQKKYPLSMFNVREVMSPSVSQTLDSWLSATGCMKDWWGEGSDNFNFDNRFTSIDVHDIMSSEEAKLTVLPYLLFKLRQEVCSPENRLFLFIDEAAPLLENEQLSKFIRLYVEQGRKLGASIALAAQTMESLIGDKNKSDSTKKTLLTNCQTQIIFPDPANKIKKETFAGFNLTEKELEFVCKTNATNLMKPHTVLVRHTGIDSKIIDADLSALGSLLNIFKGSAENNERMTSFMNSFGDQWLNHYLNAMTNTDNKGSIYANN